MRSLMSLLAFASGAFTAWLVTADHYGHIYRGDLTAGIMCRVHGLDTVRTGFLRDSETLCADLSEAIPEAVLWDKLSKSLEEQ